MWLGGDNDREGPFILPPAHAAVYRYAACMLLYVSEHEEPGEGTTGREQFDRLTWGQKNAAVLEVSRGVLNPRSEPPQLTATLQATVDAIYGCCLQGEIESEIDTEAEKEEDLDKTHVRRLVLAAMDEMDYWNLVNDALPPEDHEPPLAVGCRAYGEWVQLTDALVTELLEDFDYAAEKEDPKPERLIDIERQLRVLLHVEQGEGQAAKLRRLLRKEDSRSESAAFIWPNPDAARHFALRPAHGAAFKAGARNAVFDQDAEPLSEAQRHVALWIACRGLLDSGSEAPECNNIVHQPSSRFTVASRTWCAAS